MKEKVRNFLCEGGLELVMAWFNVSMLLFCVVRNCIDGDYDCILADMLLFFPWILLFAGIYKSRKLNRKMVDVVVFWQKACLSAVDEVDRYMKMYGKLPLEEKGKVSGTDKEEGK